LATKNVGRQPKVNEGVFAAVKIALSNGKSLAEIGRFMDLTDGTVALIRDSGSLEEYREEMKRRSRECHEKARQKKEGVDNLPAVPNDGVKEIKTTVTVQATKFMEDKIAEGVDLLKGISAKLATIIDDLYGTNSKGA